MFRVFKKASSDGRITVYLGRRDFVDHVTGSDPIDGVVNIDRCAGRRGSHIAVYASKGPDADCLALFKRRHFKQWFCMHIEHINCKYEKIS